MTSDAKANGRISADTGLATRARGGSRSVFRYISLRILFNLGTIAWTLIGCIGVAQANTGSLPKGTNLTSMIVIKESDLGSTAEGVMISTLQGAVAKRSGNQIYIVGSSAGCNIWYDHLKTAYGIPYTITTNRWLLLGQLKTLINGYILYDRAGNSNSLNVATSLCGPFNAIAVDAGIEATVRAYGVTNRILDVRLRDEAWAWANYSNVFSREILVEQTESIGANLRDYATMSGAFTFFDGNSSFRSSLLKQMMLDAACFGAGESSAGENIPVGNGSSNGVFAVGADWALSLSTLSSVQDGSIHQRTYKTLTENETNVHYVTFVTTDGDNVQWNIGDLAGYFTNAARGSFDMGWAISPALADVAPSVLRWYFDHASSAQHRDMFVAGTSGIGYFYPSMYPASALDVHLQKLNDFMDRADLNLVHVNDFGSFGRLDLWNKYLAQPNIDGLFYVEYSRYNAIGGAVLFSSNGRPIISARDLWWQGVEEPAQAISNINSYPRDVSSWAGYTLVQVHVWTKILSDVQNVVTNLAPDVRVVTPDVFVKRVRDNVGRRLDYDFGASAQGWFGQTLGGAFDKAVWTGTTGNPAGCLLLAGIDGAIPDSNPNASFLRQVILPQNVQTLRFDSRADGHGLLRVQIRDSAGALTTLLDWEQLSVTDAWVTRSASLTNFAGQTVTIYFHQNDGGPGSNPTRYVDNVSVVSDGPALYLPDAPRLLSVTATNDQSIAWRDNSSDESGFKIERRIGNNGDWVEIASVPTDATNYCDTTIRQGTNFSYRVRAWNTAGNSPYSNVRTVTTPQRPAVMITPSTNGLQLTWPIWATNFGLYSTTSLGPSAIWLPITNAVTNTNDGIGVSISPNASNSFFRLHSK
jgi:hypothetical protein